MSLAQKKCHLPWKFSRVTRADFSTCTKMRGSNFAPRLANITVDKLDDNVKKWLNAEFSARFFLFFKFLMHSFAVTDFAN